MANPSYVRYEFIVGHVASEGFEAIDGRSYIGSASEAFAAFKAEPDAFSVGQTKAEFKKAAQHGSVYLGGNLILQCRLAYRPITY